MSDIPPPPGWQGGDHPPPRRPPPPPPPDLAPPPAYSEYSPAASPSSPLKRVSGLATAATVLAAVVGTLTLLSALVAGLAMDEAEDFLEGSISEDDFIAAYAPSVLLGLVQTAAFAALIVVTMIVMYRMASNHRLLGRTGTWGPGWAIGGWFLPPFVLYVIPWLMFRELWRASDPDVPLHDERWKRGPVARVVDVWWVLYGLAPLVLIVIQGINTFGSGITTGSTEALAEQVDEQYAISVASGVLTLAAAIAYILMIRGLADRHRRLTGESRTAA